MSLENLKSKYFTLTDKINKLKLNRTDLEFKFTEVILNILLIITTKVIKSKDELENKFELITNDI